MSYASRQREAEREAKKIKNGVTSLVKPTKTFRISKDGKAIGKPKFYRQREALVFTQDVEREKGRFIPNPNKRQTVGMVKLEEPEPKKGDLIVLNEKGERV